MEKLTKLEARRAAVVKRKAKLAEERRQLDAEIRRQRRLRNDTLAREIDRAIIENLNDPVCVEALKRAAPFIASPSYRRTVETLICEHQK